MELHQLYQIAGLVRAIKLMDQYLIPAIFTGTCGARQGEKESAICNAAGAA